MVEKDKRIRIFCGHYGSGKTEVALNYTMLLRQKAKKVAIADLDIVNVYFRSREKKEELESQGIEVISSSITQNSSDMPALSASMVSPIEDRSYEYVIDLGGNDVGTIVLGRIREKLKQEEIDFFMVVNKNRPDTSSVEKVIEQMHQIERGSGFKVTGLINNTNLIRLSDANDLLQGEEMLKTVSALTGVPLKYTTYIKELVNVEGLSFEGELLPMDFYMRQEWM